MFNYLLLFVLLSPLAGIWELEHGAYSITYGRDGAPNGAFGMFLVYVVLVYSIFLMVRVKPSRDKNQLVLKAIPGWRFREQALVCLLVIFGFTILILFGAGGISVLSSTTQRGEFRSSLGGLGAILYLGLKWIVPALMAYIALLYRNTAPNMVNRLLLFAIIVCTFIFGASWGFKSAALGMMMPAAIVLFPRPSLKRVAIILAGGGLLIVAFASWFDASVTEQSSAFQFIWERVTTIQGDVPWGMWGSYQDGYRYPSYWPTLWAAFGDHFLTIFMNTSPAHFGAWAEYHLARMMTMGAGADVNEIQGGHSVTGTPFVEGIVMGGGGGIVFFAIITGLIAGLIERLITRLVRNRRPVEAAVAATYGFVIIAWINSGGIVQILHIATFFGIALCYVLLRAISLTTFHATGTAITSGATGRDVELGRRTGREALHDNLPVAP